MVGVTNVGVPAWLVGLVGAWSLSFEVGAAATVGYVAQWTLKAPSNVRDWVSPVVTLGVCVLLWCTVLGHAPKEYPLTREWVAEFLLWTLSAMGASSAAGRTGGAPPTNSL